MPVPLADDSEFQAVIAATELLLKRGAIRLRFGPSGKTRFVVDNQSLKEGLQNAGLPEDKFLPVFNAEIAPLIDAVIQNRVQRYALGEWPFPGSMTPEEVKARDERVKQILQRASLVEKALITPSLKARFQIKVLSKNTRMKSLTWEISEKRFEPIAKGPVSYPYATLSLETVRTDRDIEEALSWLPFFPPESMGRSDHVTFDVDEEDLSELIKSLEAAKAALAQAHEGGKHE